jgi:hypothetical protein
VSRSDKRRPPANWKPHRDLSPEGKAFTATHPSLYLHIWCNFSGVHCVAHVDWLDEKGKLVRLEIAKASWRPPEVTETLVVEWGERALSRWLESRQEGGEQPS